MSKLTALVMFAVATSVSLHANTETILADDSRIVIKHYNFLSIKMLLLYHKLGRLSRAKTYFFEKTLGVHDFRANQTNQTSTKQ
jgi:hypothetical protein